MNVKILSAGAGSGKTYRLMQELTRLLGEGVRTEGIVATTFTKKAAAELRERVMLELLQKGRREDAAMLGSALIGTVHSIGLRWLERFAFEAGISPKLRQIPDDEVKRLFKQAMAEEMTDNVLDEMSDLCERLSLGDSRSKEPFDWQSVVFNIAEAARSYAMDEVALTRSKALSVQSMQHILGAPVADGSNVVSDLRRAFETALSEKPESDDTKATNTCIATAERLFRSIDRGQMVPWSEWARFSKDATKVGVKSKAAFLPVFEAANNVLQHPDLQRDILTFIERVFDLAQASIDRYARFKSLRGLVDIADMEVLQYELLKRPEVADVLRNELQLLMVDEFQDTSPMQLAIFLRLTEMANEAIWVGDPKQSIYGFRGADPRIMRASIDALGGVRPENILGTSYRSRKAIVDVCNAVFVRAFDGQLPADQVALATHRADLPGQLPALHHWHFTHDEGKWKVAYAFEAYAASVAKVLAEKWLVYPKDANALRVVLPGDIAVLCKTNKECISVAAALGALGIKASVAQYGLLDTSEATLLLAGLRFMYSTRDTLALAEWALFVEQFTTESLFQHRLDYLSTLGVGEKDEWLHDAGSVSRLLELRKAANQLSPSELQQQLMTALDIRTVVAAWPSAQIRLENIERLLALAYKYEDQALKTRQPVSLGGYLLWLDEQKGKETDRQSAGEDMHAVRVETYHKSKGLEYPVVIMGQLEAKLKDSLFGLNLEASGSPFDMQQPLDGLWLRYWVQPLGGQIGKTSFEEAANASEFKVRSYANAMAEDARVLYVGMTRARDYLILPTFDNTPPIWLNRVYSSDEQAVVLDVNIDASPFEWDSRAVPLSQESLVLSGLDAAEITTERSEVRYFAPQIGRASHPSITLEVATGNFAAKMLQMKPFKAWPSVQGLASAWIVDACTAMVPNKTVDEVKALWRRYIPSPFHDSILAEFDFVCAHWVAHWQTEWQIVQVWPVFPFELKENGRERSLEVHWLAEDAQQRLWVVQFDDETTDQELAIKRQSPLLATVLPFIRSKHAQAQVGALVCMPYLGITVELG